MTTPFAHICVLPTKDAGPTKFFTAPSDPRGVPVYLEKDSLSESTRSALNKAQKALRSLSFKDAEILAALEAISRELEPRT